MAGGDPGLLKPIVLAHEPPFRLGDVEIVPATRQIVDAGLRETLEPRVMQVLVALARAEGAILSHDDLIACCWDGRVVGENAIHRVISRLREVATHHAGAFEVETITKVGYRIRTSGSPIHAPAPAAIRSPSRGPLWRRLGMIGAGAAALLGGGIAGAAWYKGDRAEEARLAIVPGGDAASNGLARGLAIDLARLPANGAGGLSIVSNPAGADYLVRVSSQNVRGGADISLHDGSGRHLLWSMALGGDLASSVLRDRGSVKVAAIMRCLAVTRNLDPPIPLEVVSLYLSACERGRDPITFSVPDDRQVALFEEVTRRAPHFAKAWAELALAQTEAAQALSFGPAAGNPEEARLRRAAELSLSKARQLDPDVGEIYVAQAALTKRRDWESRLAIVEQGIARDPTNPLLHLMKADLLRVTGCIGASLQSARRASELDPLSLWIENSLIAALAYAGHDEQALERLDRFHRLWPNAAAVQDARYRIHYRLGDPRIALAMLTRGEVTDASPLSRSFLQARIDPTSVNVEAALEAMETQRRASFAAMPLFVQNLVQLGRIDEAFALLETEEGLEAIREGPEVLFRAHMAPLRADPRFLQVTARLGLFGFWVRTKTAPDFCWSDRLRYDCASELKKAMRIAMR